MTETLLVVVVFDNVEGVGVRNDAECLAAASSAQHPASLQQVVGLLLLLEKLAQAEGRKIGPEMSIAVAGRHLLRPQAQQRHTERARNRIQLLYLEVWSESRGD